MFVQMQLEPRAVTEACWAPKQNSGTRNIYNIIKAENKTKACNWQKRKLYI